MNLTSRKVMRGLPWVSGFVLLAGAAAALVAFVPNTGKEVEETFSTLPAQVAKQRKTVPLDTQARITAGRWILGAVAREDLAGSWPLTHPELRQGLTRKQWLTGNIPVQYYPAGAIDKAPFSIDESYENEVVLEVALLSKPGSGVKPQIFYIGLKKHGKGKDRRWKVYYWAPRSGYEAPADVSQ